MPVNASAMLATCKHYKFVGTGVMVCALLCLHPATRLAAQAQDPSPYRKLDTLARALAHLERSHVEAIEEDELIYGAIRGMLRSLDPHSSFLEPDAYRVLMSDTEGRYAGIGVEVDVRDGWLTVTAVNPGGPAGEAGVLPGDRFLSIEGRMARDMPIDEAVQHIRGEPGTEVDVSLRREGQEEAIPLKLVRRPIDIESVSGRLLSDRLLYLRLRAFQDNTPRRLTEVMDAAVDAARPHGGVRGVLLDLRDNPGGLVAAAVAVADAFISEGLLVSTRGRGGQLLRSHRARAAGTRPAWPMVVLVNSYSASASEIVAGALRDHKRAVIVGERTFGKGSVQTIIELPDGSAMKLTTARYYTPSGTSIQAAGIEPDVAIPQLKPEGVEAAKVPRDDIREATLDGHLSAGPLAPRQSAPTLERGEVRGPRAEGQGEAPQAFVGDYQGAMAHQMLRALLMARDD